MPFGPFGCVATAARILGLDHSQTTVALASVRYARLQVTTTDGRVLVAQGDEFTYEPESPEQILTREADGVLPAGKIERACELIDGLEDVSDVAELTACLVPKPGY